MKHYIAILPSFWMFTKCHTNLNLGSRLFVVERGSGHLAVIDVQKLKVIQKIPLSDNLRHAFMIFDSSLHFAYLATRNGILTRVNLESFKEGGILKTSTNSIGIIWYCHFSGRDTYCDSLIQGAISMLSVELDESFPRRT